MSKFATIFGSHARPALERELGRRALYIDGDTKAVTVLSNVILPPFNTDEQDEDPRGRMLVRNRVAKLSVDASGTFGGIATPRENDYLQIDGEDWEIDGINHLSESMVELRLVQRNTVDRSRSGYRR